MKTNRVSGFTLVEMLTVMAIIAVIASLVVAISGLVNKKAATSRAEGEIKALTAALETYKADKGAYPDNEDTNELNPRVDGVATDKKYTKANLFLYSELSGDAEPDEQPDFKPEPGKKTYFTFKPDMIGKEMETSTGKIKRVRFIQDPFGQPYGYSTAAAKEEADYRELLRSDARAAREPSSKGYNTTSFDLWSTGGSTSRPTASSTGGDIDQTRWVKNW